MQRFLCERRKYPQDQYASLTGILLNVAKDVPEANTSLKFKKNTFTVQCRIARAIEEIRINWCNKKGSVTNDSHSRVSPAPLFRILDSLAVLIRQDMLINRCDYEGSVGQKTVLSFFVKTIWQSLSVFL